MTSTAICPIYIIMDDLASGCERDSRCWWAVEVVGVHA